MIECNNYCSSSPSNHKKFVMDKEDSSLIEMRWSHQVGGYYFTEAANTPPPSKKDVFIHMIEFHSCLSLFDRLIPTNVHANLQ